MFQNISSSSRLLSETGLAGFFTGTQHRPGAGTVRKRCIKERRLQYQPRTNMKDDSLTPWQRTVAVACLGSQQLQCSSLNNSINQTSTKTSQTASAV